VDVVQTGAPATNYLALSVANLAAQVGAFDLDFIALPAGRARAGQFDLPVAIVQEPVSQAIALGARASFNVGVTGTPPMLYQWYRSGVAILNATNRSYTTAPLQPSDQGATFSVTVSTSAAA